MSTNFTLNVIIFYQDHSFISFKPYFHIKRFRVKQFPLHIKKFHQKSSSILLKNHHFPQSSLQTPIGFPHRPTPQSSSFNPFTPRTHLRTWPSENVLSPIRAQMDRHPLASADLHTVACTIPHDREFIQSFELGIGD